MCINPDPVRHKWSQDVTKRPVTKCLVTKRSSKNVASTETWFRMLIRHKYQEIYDKKNLKKICSTTTVEPLAGRG